jgi:hypothetical protein
MSESESKFEHDQEQAAAAEAGAIGGRVSSEPPGADDDALDPAQAPLIEAGEGEAEGFEQSERALIEHASHGDEHGAGRVLQDAPRQSEDDRAAEPAAGDQERTSERPDD